MNADRFSSRVETTISTLPTAIAEWWRARRARVRAQTARVVLFAAGVAAAFSALLLYQALFPAPHALTTQQVDTSIA
jgi:hypothetical protein